MKTFLTSLLIINLTLLGFIFNPSITVKDLKSPLQEYIDTTMGQTVCYLNDCLCAGLVKDYVVKNGGTVTSRPQTIVYSNYTIKDELEVGDLILYDTGKYSHIVIYIGNDKIFHQNNAYEFANITNKLNYPFIILDINK